MNEHDHLLDEAKEFLSIAEQVDEDPRKAKRQAYMAAAERVATYIEATGSTQTMVATIIGRNQPDVGRMLKWHRSGYKAETPFLMDPQATTRAAVSHSKKVLREQPKTLAPEIAKALEDPEVAQEVVKAASRKAVDTMRDAAADEGFDRAMTRREERTGKKRPTVKKLLHGKTPQEISDDLIKNTMNRWLDRFLLEEASTWAQYESKGFRLIEPSEIDDYRTRLVVAGQHIAGLLDALDQYEASEASQAEASQASSAEGR